MLVAAPGVAGVAAARVPSTFFGIGPQTPLTQVDTDRMARGGIQSVRWPLPWSYIQRSGPGTYDWAAMDETVAAAARSGLDLLPFLYSTPSWLAKSPTILPVQTGRQRQAWKAFVSRAVSRYGPTGSFWVAHNSASSDPLPFVPIHHWQIWNEANFFYFATPASPTLYAKLLKLAAPAVKGIDPNAKVILSGLFGHPETPRARGLDADAFLDEFYRTPGIKAYFDGVALHPYAADADSLKRFVASFGEVTKQNGDGGVGLYLTEVGWGSQGHSPVSFEKGYKGQAQELRDAYRYLIANQRRLRLKGVYWFSWKDARSSTCSFCDSVGLFRSDYVPKASWYAFTRLANGDPSPPPEPPLPPPSPPSGEPPPRCVFPLLFC